MFTDNGFDVNTMYMDTEFEIPGNGLIGVNNLKNAVADEHIPKIECQICFVKD